MPSWYSHLRSGPASEGAHPHLDSSAKKNPSASETRRIYQKSSDPHDDPATASDAPHGLNRMQHSRPSHLAHSLTTPTNSQIGGKGDECRKDVPLASEDNKVQLSRTKNSKKAVPRTQETQASSHADNLTSGSCATCNSRVRWPRTVESFRCMVCLMINDLKFGHERANYSSQSFSGKSSHSLRPAAPVSLHKTKQIAIECIDRHISSPEAWIARASTSAQHDEFMPKAQDTTLKLSDMHGNRDSSSMVFLDLEKYIISCFDGMTTLNSSFQISRTTSPTRSRDSHNLPSPDGLCASDLGPQASPFKFTAWNCARGTGDTSSATSSRSGVDYRWVEQNGGKVNKESPDINWREVHEWYHVLFTLYHLYRTQLKQARPTASQSAQDNQGNLGSQHVQHDMNKNIIKSCEQVVQTVMKGTENLLRRPGCPISSPADCRFLLIILANPLLTSSTYGGQSSECLLLPNSQFSGRNVPLPHQPTKGDSNLRQRHQSARGTVEYSRILKRVLGIISNLSSQCHQHFVNWFSRFSEAHLRSIVDCADKFVSYRILRLKGQKTSDVYDLTTGGLVPNVSGTGASTPAQLHAALGDATGPQTSKLRTSSIQYGHDWQIKAAAKVMLLLFTASHGTSPQRSCDASQNTKVRAELMSYSLGCHRVHRQTPLLPTHSFYNTLLDHCDLVADFETWEQRKGPFCFCQYPFFLSIWAKIQILEHDARRQMEIKAREAFFNSIIGRKAVSQYLHITVRRNCLVEDSLRNVGEIIGTGQEEFKKGLRIKFEGEEGLDSGGLRKEWFLLLAREIFDADHGLFTYDEDSHFCYFNPHAFETSDQFYLVGVLLGLAIYNSTILDVALPPFAFRKLLASAPTYSGLTSSLSRQDYKCTLEDLAEYRPALAQGLKKLLECDSVIEDTFALDFVATTDRFGQIQQIPLCPNGARRPVTLENRHEFVDLYVRYILDTSVSRQYDPFKRGFFTVCGGNALSLFRPEEIELLIRGSDEPLDVATLEAVASYDGWGKLNDPVTEPVVQWFWAAFLNAPAMGAANLVIRIVCLGDDCGRFPIARTCFNMLGLFRYPMQQVFEAKLWRAVMESEGFGIK